MKHVPLSIMVIAFVCGVALESYFDLGLVFGFFILFIASVFFLLPLKALSEKKTRYIVMLILVTFAFGVVRSYVAYTHNEPPSILYSDIEKESVFEGVIIGEPDERENHVKLTVEVTYSYELSDTYKILILVPLYPSFEYGDRVLVRGIIKTPTNFVSEDTQREFNYKMYLMKDNIHFLVFFPQIEIIEKNQGGIIKEKLFSIKNSFLESIGNTIHEPYAALLGGLVVGAKRSLGDEMLEMFRITGIIHIVVLSGYNVTIVAYSLMRFFSFLPRVATLFLGGGSIILFAIMTGGSATVVRASIMALLVVVGHALGHTSQLPRLLMIALFIMVMHNPYIVLYDPSFQLSFIAMLGLIYLAPILEKRFTFLTDKFALRSIAAATVSTQIAVLPMLLYLMGSISLVALPVNLLILVFIPLTMLFGFLAGVLGMISTTIAMPMAILTYILLYYEISIVKIFAAVPYASVTVKHFPLWVLVVFYMLYIVLYLRLVKQKNKE